VPTLIVHGDADPVAKSESSQEVFDAIRADEKELATMTFNRHVIIRGEGSGLVYERIAEFIQRLAHRCKPISTPRRGAPSS
jgi:esterase/lipase